MDKETRSAIERATQKARKLLEDDFADQLAGTFDVLRDGTVAPKAGSHLSPRKVVQREKVVAAIGHKRAAGMTAPAAVADYLRDAAFTTLNRFVALKMLEARELVQECITKGEESVGYREFCGLAPGVALLPESAGYRLYIESLFDELSTEVRVLFNRRDATSALWPGRTTLSSLLATLNVPELAEVWGEDETLGWVYQYYNSADERKKMRDESAAPRNSRELAVRNQFFTPRYVVEFLADNALGRTWYEMTKGETRLKTECKYLIRRPTEVFLKSGETTPEQPKQGSQPQEEWLKQPVYIPHRALKDPRTILMLDPACGSMHFGLYAFDLFEVVYEEAWDLEGTLGSDALSRPADTRPLHECYATKDAFLKDVPRLIIQHNLHGIDIDPRCVQIAGLSLWLRAQKAWQRMKVKRAGRPIVKRSNIVCAEPMPGEKELLREFIDREFPVGERSVFLRLMEAIFDKMQLAGEAGSLLKLEDEIRSAISEAKVLWKQKTEPQQVSMLGDPEPPRQKELEIDLTGITDQQFWATAEERIYAALRRYAERAESGRDFQRRLFADDAERGFAFIDLCRQRYDVALMNPPFGDASLPSKAYLDDTYGDTKGDVYKAFVECFQTRLVPAGFLGIISSRTGFFLGQSEDWRSRVVLRLFRPIVLADLGMGVLDAMVEVAAYVLRSLSEQEARDLTRSLVPVLATMERDKQDLLSVPKWQAARNGLKRHQAIAELEHLETHGIIQRRPGVVVRYAPLWDSVKKVTAPPDLVYPPLVCIRATGEADKREIVASAVGDPRHPLRFECSPSIFQSLPSAPFAYWLTSGLQRVFQKFPRFASEQREVRQGLATADDFRFLRVWWEVPPAAISPPQVHPLEPDGAYCVPNYRWFPICRGGARQAFYRDLCAVVDWARDGETLRAFPGSVVRNPDFYFRPGFSWPLRGIVFSAQAVPSGSLFSVAGKLACADRKARLLPLLALANSQLFDRLLTLFAGKVGGVQYEVGLLARIPIPPLDQDAAGRLSVLARDGWRARLRIDLVSGISHAFHLPALLAVPGTTLAERASAWAACVRTDEGKVADILSQIDDLAFHLYGLDAADRAALTVTLSIDSAVGGGAEAIEDEEEEAVSADASAKAQNVDLLAYALGAAFGRWDVRLATGKRVAPPEPDPFDPLPVCAPALLQGATGLPATRAEVPIDYPLRISWAGILVDDPHHPDDIGQRLREFFELLWPKRVDATEHEVCAILDVKSLRQYFCKPTGFFAHHLKRYSKSRRQAPLYWPLSSWKGLYTVWLYYHRLTPDTLFTVLRDHVKPKLEFEERRVSQLTQDAGSMPSSVQRKEIAEAEELVNDLRGFRDELTAVAPLFRPNLNDGVIINHAPLWRMAGLPKWRKDCQAVWEELAKGDYDWSHLAMHLWPERVVPKCATDRSLAIAHGLEDVFWVAGEDGKWTARVPPTRPVDELVRERTSSAVKAALTSLPKAAAAAPVAGAPPRRRVQRAAAAEGEGR